MRTNTNPHTPAATTLPEIADAMANGRQYASLLRAAITRREAMNDAPTLKAAGAMREQIAGIRADLRSIADRAYLDVDVLIFLLDEEHRLNISFRRKPTLDQLRKGVARRIGETECEEAAAHEALTTAQERVTRATAHRVAVSSARHLLGAVS